MEFDVECPLSFYFSLGKSAELTNPELAIQDGVERKR